MNKGLCLNYLLLCSSIVVLDYNTLLFLWDSCFIFKVQARLQSKRV